MRAIVTGAAGFIGSHLSARLLAHGDEVVGIDCFTDYYSPLLKEQNVQGLLAHPHFTLHRADIVSTPLAPLFDGADVVFHLAGQPGVRGSWGKDFWPYVRHNVLGTQMVLESVAGTSIRKVVYASSSSVYGNAETAPTCEDVRPSPVSPYGVTKLAAEHLSELYRIGGTPTVSLRFFTAYGPRQRPDMAFSRLISSALAGEPFLLYGDGTQSRDFTYVDDVVRAVHRAGLSSWTGVANVGGGSRTTMNEAIALVSELVGEVAVVRLPVQRGDVRHTSADITTARRGFGYEPRVGIREGLTRMVEATGAKLAAGV